MKGSGHFDYEKVHAWFHGLSFLIHVLTCTVLVFAAISLANSASHLEDTVLRYAADVAQRAATYLETSPPPPAAGRDDAPARFDCSGFLRTYSGSDLSAFLKNLSSMLGNIANVDMPSVNALIERLSGPSFFGDVHSVSEFANGAGKLLGKLSGQLPTPDEQAQAAPA